MGQGRSGLELKHSPREKSEDGSGGGGGKVEDDRDLYGDNRRIKSINKIFSMYDGDGDGHLDQSELERMIIDFNKKHRCTAGSKTMDVKDMTKTADVDAARILSALDTDGNGTIEDHEWVDWILRGMRRPREERREFRNASPENERLDDFFVALQLEIEATAFETEKGRQRAELAQLFRMYDMDGDGMLAAKELQSMVGDMHNAIDFGAHKNSRTPSGMRYKAALVAQNIMAVMDEDKDGYITVREWTEWSLRQLGETKARRRRKAKSDANIENFLRALETTIATERKRLLLAVISQLFLKYDQNSDGHIDETDVAKMIVDLKSNSVDESHRNDVSHASEDAKSIVTSFDRDGNGMVELDEWVYFVGEGISRSAAARQKLAQSSSEYARLDRFLKAIEFYAVEMSDLVAVQNEEVKNTTVDQGDASDKSEGKVQDTVEVAPADVLEQDSDAKSFEDWGDDDDAGVQMKL